MTEITPPASRPLTMGLLEDTKQNKNAVITSTVVNGVALLLLLLISAQHYIVKEQPRLLTNITFLKPPALRPIRVHPEVVKLPTLPPRAVITPPKPIPAPVPIPQPAKVPVPAPPKAVAPPPPAKPSPNVSNRPTVVANNTVQPTPHVGGFGNPLGAHINPDAKPSPIPVPTVGAFAAAPGSGEGAGSARKGVVTGTSFGSGPANGIAGGTSRGIVASAGFSSGVPGGTGRPGGSGNGSVAGTSFGKTVATQTVAPIRSTGTTQTATVTYVPKPIYTADARARHIEGDVVLKVRLTADGRVEVLGIVRSLEPGLDQQALSVAQHIQFRPATNDGKPVDMVTNIHITFQLA